jgi:hypothetical protein
MKTRLQAFLADYTKARLRNQTQDCCFGQVQSHCPKPQQPCIIFTALSNFIDNRACFMVVVYNHQFLGAQHPKRFFNFFN